MNRKIKTMEQLPYESPMASEIKILTESVVCAVSTFVISNQSFEEATGDDIFKW